MKCVKCQCELHEANVFETDEFGMEGSPTKLYCLTCLIEGFETDFGKLHSPIVCEACNNKVVAMWKHDLEEQVSLIKDEGLFWLACENWQTTECLEQEVGYYLISPPEDSNWWGV